jgi:dienelactone hydrolase
MPPRFDTVGAMLPAAGRATKSAVIWIAALGFGSLSCAQTQDYQTSVVPQSGETLAGPCVYRLTLPKPERAVKGVFVIFDRGEQVRSLYSDAAVLQFATRGELGVVLALHCPAKGSNDIDVIPENGIGRALLTALDQFATASKHPELSRVALIYFGMSGAGSLAARMVNSVPQRTIAAIEYAPDSEDPVGIDTVNLNEKALAVPQFIIANGADTIVGTARPYAYFEQYRKLGAPLTFMIQNRTTHCCAANVIPVALPWLADVVRLREPSADGGMTRIDLTRGWLGTLDVRESGTREQDPPVKVWNAVGAETSPSAQQPLSSSLALDIPRSPDDTQVPGSAKLLPAWLPTREFAQTWQAFSQLETHPFTPQR